MYSQLNPGTLFYIVDWLFLFFVIFMILRKVVLRFFPNLFDSCPRLGGQLESSAESKKFDKVLLDRKKSVTFYDLLSTRQK